MSRGEGSKGEGRIAGYETADFILVKDNIQNFAPIHNKEKKLKKSKKSSFGIIFLIVIFIGSALNYCTKSPDIETGGNTVKNIDSNEFTQTQITAHNESDKKIGELLKAGWTMTKNLEGKNSLQEAVGSKWKKVSSNESQLLEVSTSYQYYSHVQSIGYRSFKIELRELKENEGIILDSTVAEIIKIYNSSIDIESVSESVTAAYNTNYYYETLVFSKNFITITSKNNGKSISVIIELKTTVSKSN